MMIVLWLTLLALSLLASVFVCWPFFIEKAFRKTAIVLTILFMLSALGLYVYLGASENLAILYKIEMIIERIQEKVQAHPNDPQGWYVLGRIYAIHHHYSEALQCFEKAAALAPQRKEIKLAMKQVQNLSQTDREGTPQSQGPSP